MKRNSITRVMPDGRVIYSDAMYKATLEYMTRRQDGKCAICGRIMGFPTFDHAAGRGMGGSKRDDRPNFDDGSPRNAALCWNCNALKGSKPYHWVDGKYIPKTS